MSWLLPHPALAPIYAPFAAHPYPHHSQMLCHYFPIHPLPTPRPIIRHSVLFPYPPPTPTPTDHPPFCATVIPYPPLPHPDRPSPILCYYFTIHPYPLPTPTPHSVLFPYPPPTPTPPHTTIPHSPLPPPTSPGSSLVTPAISLTCHTTSYFVIRRSSTAVARHIIYLARRAVWFPDCWLTAERTKTCAIVRDLAFTAQAEVIVFACQLQTADSSTCNKPLQLVSSVAYLSACPLNPHG
jgi:hypothetical protein